VSVEFSPEMVKGCRDAAALIEERGWYQGGWYGGHGEVCLVAALREAIEDHAVFWATAEALADVVAPGWRHSDPRPTWSLADWQDEPARTVEEVLGLLRNQKI
jgi:hypothetical protein